MEQDTVKAPNTHRHHWQLHIYFNDDRALPGQPAWLVFLCECGEEKTLTEVISILDHITNIQQQK